MRTTSQNTQTTKTVSRGHEQPPGERPLHKLAADVELATPAGERWCVQVDDYNESGRVYLELADATSAEAERGMALLTKLVG